MPLKSIIKAVGSKVEIKMVGLINETLANPTFTRFTVKAMESTLWVKPSIEKNLRFAYKSMNLTPRDDFDNLTVKVNELSKKQGDLDAKIEKLGRSIEENH